jgi:hypothetical protein
LDLASKANFATEPADHLQHRPATAATLAHTLGVNASALLRILRGLVSLGVCAENAEGQSSLTSAGAYLRSDHPDSLQPRLLFNGEVQYALWMEALATVQTGRGVQSSPLRHAVLRLSGA